MSKVLAKGRYIKVSPRKAKLVADLVKGMGVERALAVLSVTKKKSSPIISKIINSAVANAEQRGDIDVDTLFVKNILVDQGPMLKRVQPSYGGRINRILKRYSHITVILEEKY